MPDNHPRAQLCFILNKYGRSIIDDPRHCRTLLTERAPLHRLEISLLITALGQQVAQELLNPTALIPVAMQLERLAQGLHDNVGIQKDFAYWAVESWALALKVIHQPKPKQIVQSKPKASPTPSKKTKIIPSSPALQQGIRKSITIKSFIENSSIPSALIRAVVNQSGGWEAFRESAPFIVKDGAGGGYSGFDNYTETVKFARKNKMDILSYARAQAEKKNMLAFQLIADLEQIKQLEISIDRLAEVINCHFRDDDETYTLVFNGLAWFTLEECAQAWVEINSKVYSAIADTVTGNTT